MKELNMYSIFYSYRHEKSTSCSIILDFKILPAAAPLPSSLAREGGVGDKSEW